MTWFLQSLVSFFATTIIINGPIPQQVASSPPTIVYQGSQGDISNTDVYTFTDVAIGSESSRDHVIVIAEGIGGTSAYISGVTIGGSSATEIGKHEVTQGTSNRGVAIYAGTVATGTTTTVVVTYGANYYRCRLYSYTSENLVSLTAQDTATFDAEDQTAAFNLDLVAPSGNSIGIGAVFGGVETYDWTGLTEDHQGTIESTTETSCASATFSSSGTKTITITPGATTNVVGFSACLK